MYWKQGLAMVALVAFLLSASAVSAQERADDKQRDQPGAAAGAQTIGAQDRTSAQQQPDAQRAQDQAQRRENQRGQAGQPGQPGRPGRQIDTQIAYGLVLANWEEIQLSEFAAEKAQNPQVKEFAQKMVQEHNQYMDRLQNFLASKQDDPRAARSSAGGTPAVTPRTSPDARVNQDDATEPRRAKQDRDDAEDRSDDAGAAARQPGDRAAAVAQAQPGQDPSRAAELGATGLQTGQRGQVMMQIHRDAAERCLALTKEILSEKQGKEFDKAFMSQQIVAHVGMLAKLQAVQDHVSPEFQQVVQEGAQSAEQHLKEARTIAQSLEGSNQRSGAQPGRTGAEPDRTGAQPGAQPRSSAQPDRPATPERDNP